MSAPSFERFKKSMLEEYKFPGTDAAVAFVPEGQQPSSQITQVLQQAGQHRWFPVSGGYQVKIPWHRAQGNEHLFQREKKGWDHEHCDFCENHVDMGELCWTAESDRGFWIFCNECHEKVSDK